MKQTLVVNNSRMIVDHRRPESKSSVRTLLLVHGYPLDHTMWEAQLEDLSQDHTVVAMDLPGMGRSHDLKQSTSMAEMADHLVHLLEVLEIETATFCGLSMGGYIGWEFWRRHSDRLDGLIFANTKAEADDEATRRARVINAQALDSNGIAIAAESLIPRLFAPNTESDVVDKVDAMIRNNNTKGAIHAQLAMANRNDATDCLSQITVPTLVIGGTEDTITPPSGMREMADAIKNSTYVEISNAGHLTPLEQPHAFNQAVRGFIDSST